MKLNKQNLVNKLGFTKEEAKFIVDTQEEIPILASDDAFVWGRTLHKQLEVANHYTQFINSQLVAIDAKRDVDYFVFWTKDDIMIPVNNDDNSVTVTEETIKPFKKFKNSDNFKINGTIINSNSMVDYGFTLNHKLTLVTAKEIAMVVGVSAKKQLTKEKSKKCRRYFILMEEAVKRAYTWDIERDANKAEHNELMAVYRQWSINRYGEEPQDYWRIQNMIYDIVFGLTANELKNKLEVKYHECVPNNVTDRHNEAIRYAYNRFAVFLELGLDIQECYDKTVEIFDKRYGGLMRL